MKIFILAMTVLIVSPTVVMAQEQTKAATPQSATIMIKDFDFSPMEVTIAAGGSVTWTNRDGEPHTVVSLDGTFRSHALDQDDSFTFTFSRPGTYAYLCSIHPKMRATVTVR